MKKVYALLIPVALVVAVAVNSAYWFVPYVWDAIGIGLAGSVVAAYLVTTRSKREAGPYLFVLVAAVLLTAVVLKGLAPDLTRAEVESMARKYLSNSYSAPYTTYVTSARYKGKGVWEVHYLLSSKRSSRWWSVDFDEKAGTFQFSSSSSTPVPQTRTQPQPTPTPPRVQPTPVPTPAVASWEDIYRRVMEPAGTR